MSRRAKGFKYVSGRCIETRMTDEKTASDTCKSLSSALTSASSDCPLPSLENPLNGPLVRRQDTDPLVGRGLVRKRPSHGKRRGGGGGGGEGGGGMPAISWSNERHSVSEVVKNYSKRFPVIVKVTQGYYGDGEFKLPVGQILQVYATCEQRRAKATDCAGRLLSLPSSLVVDDTNALPMDSIYPPPPLHPPPPPASRRSPSSSKSTGGTNSGILKLSEILRQKVSSLPLTMAVKSISGSSGSGGDGVCQTEDIEMANFTDQTSLPCLPPPPGGASIAIQSFYHCTYLLANVIDNGWLDSSSIVLIPADLRPVFAVALGLRDGTAEEWKDFSGMFDRSARHINFSAIEGYDGVIYDDWSEFSTTCPAKDDELEADATQAVDIARYFINKQLPIPDDQDYIRIGRSDTDQERPGERIIGCPQYDALSDVSATHASYSVPETFGPSNHLEHRLDKTRDLSLDADCVNVNEIGTNHRNRPANARRIETAPRATGQHPSDVEQRLKSDLATLGNEKIAIGKFAFETGEPSVTGKSDNRGTLVSIDEGYNSGSFFVNAQSDPKAPVCRRYSPVYF